MWIVTLQLAGKKLITEILGAKPVWPVQIVLKPGPGLQLNVKRLCAKIITISRVLKSKLLILKNRVVGEFLI